MSSQRLISDTGRAALEAEAGKLDAEVSRLEAEAARIDAERKRVEALRGHLKAALALEISPNQDYSLPPFSTGPSIPLGSRRHPATGFSLKVRGLIGEVSGIKTSELIQVLYERGVAESLSLEEFREKVNSELYRLKKSGKIGHSKKGAGWKLKAPLPMTEIAPMSAPVGPNYVTLYDLGARAAILKFTGTFGGAWKPAELTDRMMKMGFTSKSPNPKNIVAGELSRLLALGKMDRDEEGRYSLRAVIAG